MDADLNLLLTPVVRSSSAKSPREDIRLRIVDDVKGEIEVDRPSGPTRYTLKELPQLYGKGTGRSSIDPQDDIFMPLLMAIEEEIVRYNTQEDPNLTDGLALLVVKAMGLDPDTEPADRLGQHLHLALRLCLSLNDYSRQDVKGCLRQVAKSVDRHSRVAGTRGYLTFIGEFFSRARRR